MTADLTRLEGLRYRAGQTQVTLDAFELEFGCSIKDPKLIARHNALLRMNQESKDWLELAECKLTGRINFTPTKYRK